MRQAWWWGIVVVAGLVASPAVAEDRGVQAHRLPLPANPMSVHTVASPEVLDPFSLSFALYLDQADDPIDDRIVGQREVGDLVRDQLATTALVALGLPLDLTLEGRVDYVLDQDGFELDEPNRRFDPAGLGDTTLTLGWQAWTSEDARSALGLRLFGVIPTGQESAFRSDDGQTSIGLFVVGEHRFESWRILGQAGYGWREEDTRILSEFVDDRLFVGVAGELTAWRYRHAGPRYREVEAQLRRARMELRERGEDGGTRQMWDRRRPVPEDLEITELALRLAIEGETQLARPLNQGTTAFELTGGIALRKSTGWSLELGAGRGLTDGFGAPDYRLFVGLRWTFGGPTVVSGRFAER